MKITVSIFSCGEKQVITLDKTRLSNYYYNHSVFCGKLKCFRVLEN